MHVMIYMSLLADLETLLLSQNPEAGTFFTFAARYRSAELMNRLLAELPILPRTLFLTINDAFGLTPLHEAACNIQDKDVLIVLLNFILETRDAQGM